MLTMTGNGEEYLPAIPASAGALIFDRAGRLLILKPTYKSGWTIPGGVMEADGETPWDACRREVREECVIDVRGGRLACMDFRRPRPGRLGGIRFLFDCGQVSDGALAGVVVQAEEISEFRLAAVPDALGLLRKPIRRRVRAAIRGKGLGYLGGGPPGQGSGLPGGRPPGARSRPVSGRRRSAPGSRDRRGGNPSHRRGAPPRSPPRPGPVPAPDGCGTAARSRTPVPRRRTGSGSAPRNGRVLRRPAPRSARTTTRTGRPRRRRPSWWS